MKVKYDLNKFNEGTLEEFNIAKEHLKKSIDDNFVLRQQPCTLIIGKEKIETQLKFMMLNMIFLSFFVKTGIPIIKEDLYLKPTYSGKDQSNYLNYCLERFEGTGRKDFDAYKKASGEVINEINSVVHYGLKYGTSLSLLDFVIPYATDEEAVKLFKPNPDDINVKFDDIAEVNTSYENKLYDYFKHHPDNNIYQYVSSDSGINKKQFRQCASYVGVQPGMRDEIIPKVISSNFLFGLDDMEDYYIVSVGARKAAIVNYMYVRKSGYLTRKIDSALVDIYHDNDLPDCNTKHLVTHNVTNEKRLRQLDGRSYKVTSADGLESELVIDAKKDQHLIGTSVEVYSPVTCAAEHICPRCYGRNLSEKNKDLHTGLVASKTLNAIMTQKLLSVKHLLEAAIKGVKFEDGIVDSLVFTLNKVNIDPRKNIKIRFKTPTEEDFDEDMGSSFINKITIIDVDNKTEEDYVLPTPFYICEDVKLSEDENTTLEYNDSIESIFYFDITNNEITKSLEAIIHLIEASDHLGETTYNGMVNRFCDLLIENDINSIKSVHIEMIVSAIIVDIKNKKRLDFSKTTLPEYKVIRISNSILNGPITKSLSFERIQQQLIDLDTYEKEDESYMDHLFK